MQHDLKMTEVRQPETSLAAWCVCAGWRYQSANLHLQPVVDGFIKHVDEVMPYVNYRNGLMRNPFPAEYEEGEAPF